MQREVRGNLKDEVLQCRSQSMLAGLTYAVEWMHNIGRSVFPAGMDSAAAEGEKTKRE